MYLSDHKLAPGPSIYLNRGTHHFQMHPMAYVKQGIAENTHTDITQHGKKKSVVGYRDIAHKYEDMRDKIPL